MLPLSKKISYGMGRFGSSLLLAIIEMTTFFSYSTVFLLSWFFNGLAQFVGFLVIGFTHWLVGYYSDGVKSRFGRRKPFVIIGAPGLAISIIFLFIPHFFLPIGSPDIMVHLLLFLYYLTTLCLFKFFYAFLLTAFQAWLPEIADEEERPVVSSIQNTANWMGTGIGFTISFLFASEALIAGGAPTPLLLTIVVAFALIEILFYLPSMAFIREKPGLMVPPRSIKAETLTVIRNRTYAGWFMAVGFLSLTFAAIKANMIGFAQNVMQLTDVQDLAVVAISLLLSLMVFLFVWAYIAKRIGKKRSLIISLLALAFLLPLTIGVGSVPLDPVLRGVLYFLPLGLFMANYYIMSYIIPADIAHVDEIQSGEARAGMYQGFMSVPLNIFQAFSLLLLGFVMDWSVLQSGSELLGYLWWGPIFTPWILIGIIFILFIDLDPEFKELS